MCTKESILVLEDLLDEHSVRRDRSELLFGGIRTEEVEMDRSVILLFDHPEMLEVLPVSSGVIDGIWQTGRSEIIIVCIFNIIICLTHSIEALTLLRGGNVRFFIPFDSSEEG